MGLSACAALVFMVAIAVPCIASPEYKHARRIIRRATETALSLRATLRLLTGRDKEFAVSVIEDVHLACVGHLHAAALLLHRVDAKSCPGNCLTGLKVNIVLH